MYFYLYPIYGSASLARSQKLQDTLGSKAEL